jgi:hypothetical protein
MTTPIDARTSKKAYPLRIDPQVFVQVQQIATKEGRSVNRQIEFMLRDQMKTLTGSTTTNVQTSN